MISEKVATSIIVERTQITLYYITYIIKSRSILFLLFLFKEQNWILLSNRSVVLLKDFEYDRQINSTQLFFSKHTPVL